MNRLLHLFLVAILTPLLATPALIVPGWDLSSPQWSPNGRHISYLKLHGEQWGIFGVNLDGVRGDGSNPVTLADGPKVQAPALSPDGGQIAYVRLDGERFALHLMKADGSHDQRLLDLNSFDYKVSWSPNGQTILVQGNVGVETINGDGSEHRILVSAHGSDYDNEVSWSPDSRQLAVRRPGSLWVMNADGSDATAILTDVNMRGPVAWSPDGQSIAFEMTNLPGETASVSEIETIHSDGSGLKHLAKHDRYGIAWSPDSTKIAFVNANDIDVVNAGGGPAANRTNSEDAEEYPTWSPDGSQLAFVVWQGFQSEIDVMEANGGNPTRVTVNEYVKSHIAWSPDGSRLYFAGVVSAFPGIYVANADGSAPTLLSAKQAVNVYRWSPVGNQLAFIAATGELFRVKAGGSELTALTTPHIVTNFAWSPDGRHLALTDQDGLYTIDAGATVVTDAARIATQPSILPLAWSPDGSRILFSDGENGNNYLIDAAGGAVITLTTGTDYSSLSWSPDGQRLALFGPGKKNLRALDLVDADTAKLTHLIDVAGDSIRIPHWSSDGSEIIYLTYETNNNRQGANLTEATSESVNGQPGIPFYLNVYVINADGSDNHLVAHEAATQVTPSPNGDWLLVSAPRELRLVNAIDGTKVELDAQGDSYSDLSWSPDGRQLLYLKMNFVEPAKAGIIVTRLNTEP